MSSDDEVAVPENIRLLMQIEKIFMPKAVGRRYRHYSVHKSHAPFVHYTSSEAALSIIKTKRFWMRNTTCMSDFKEIEHGFDILRSNLLLNQGFFPGSGTKTLNGNAFQVRGRMEIGNRSCGMQFVARLVSGSTEYATLSTLCSPSAPAAAATVTISHDANNSVVFNMAHLAFRMVETSSADGIVTVTVTGLPMEATAISDVLTVTTKTSLAGICQ